MRKIIIFIILTLFSINNFAQSKTKLKLQEYNTDQFKEMICKKWYVVYLEGYRDQDEEMIKRIEEAFKSMYVEFHKNNDYEAKGMGRHLQGQWSLNPTENVIHITDDKGEEIYFYIIKSIKKDTLEVFIKNGAQYCIMSTTPFNNSTSVEIQHSEKNSYSERENEYPKIIIKKDED